VREYPANAAASGPVFVEAAARRFALVVAGLAASLPLLEQGAWALARGRGERSALAARRWVAERIPQLLDPGTAPGRLDASRTLSGLTD